MKEIKKTVIAINVHKAGTYEQMFNSLLSKIKGTELENFVEMRLTPNTLTMYEVKKNE